VKPTNDFVTKSVAIASNKVAIHCWRGGSNAFADHLIENGFEKFMLLKRGTKLSIVVFDQSFNLKFSVDIPVLVKLKSQKEGNK
jgi:tRNA 2-selenouridine synthase